MTSWLDTKAAVRRLIRTPFFTLSVVSMLGVGLAVAILTFAIVDGVWLRPLPYADPDRLVSLSPYSLSSADLAALEKEQSVFASVGGFSLSFPPLILPGDEPLVIRRAVVTTNFVELLGVRPLMGSPRFDDPTSSEREVLLTHRLWKQRFGSDPSIIGARLTFEDGTRRVIGVLRSDFVFPNAISDLTPDVLTTVETSSGIPSRIMRGVGRLAAGVNTLQASAVVDRDAPPKLPPNALRSTDPTVQRLTEWFIGDYVANIMRLLIGGVCVLLLIACANLTHMLIARGSGRGREISVRRALGARRHELVRLFVFEGVLLAIAGGLVATVLSMWVFHIVQTLIPATLPRSSAIGLDGRVIVGGVIFTVAVGLLSSALPALRLSRPGVADLLQRSNRGSSGRARLGKVLIAVESGLAVVLLASGSLMLTSFIQLVRTDLGFHTDGVLEVNIRTPSGLTDQAGREYVRQVRERVRALPAVERVAVTDMRPIARASRGQDLRGVGSQRDHVSADWRTVSPDYFRTLGIRVLEGREFSPADELAAIEPAILSESIARKMWPDGVVVGRRFRALDLAVDCEVIGVVADVRSFSVRSKPTEMMYLSTDRRAIVNSYLSIRLADASRMDELANPIIKEIRAVDPRAVVGQTQPLQDFVDNSISDTRLEAALFGVFGVLALAVAVAGVAGVTAYSVTQRTQEFGVRLALGVVPSRLAHVVVVESLVPAIVGSIAGIGAAVWLAQLLRGLVFGVAPNDPTTLAGVVVGLVLATAVASYAPARRASRLDPTIALRSD